MVTIGFLILNSIIWDLSIFEFIGHHILSPGGCVAVTFSGIALLMEFGLSYKKLANFNNGLPDF